MPNPSLQPKSVQAPAVCPGIFRQGQGEARRAGKDSSAQLLTDREPGGGGGGVEQGCSWQLGASLEGERTCVNVEE